MSWRRLNFLTPLITLSFWENEKKGGGRESGKEESGTLRDVYIAPNATKEGFHSPSGNNNKKWEMQSRKWISLLLCLILGFSSIHYERSLEWDVQPKPSDVDSLPEIFIKLDLMANSLYSRIHSSHTNVVIILRTEARNSNLWCYPKSKWKLCCKHQNSQSNERWSHSCREKKRKAKNSQDIRIVAEEI